MLRKCEEKQEKCFTVFILQSEWYCIYIGIAAEFSNVPFRWATDHSAAIKMTTYFLVSLSRRHHTKIISAHPSNAILILQVTTTRLQLGSLNIYLRRPTLYFCGSRLARGSCMLSRISLWSRLTYWAVPTIDSLVLDRLRSVLYEGYNDWANSARYLIQGKANEKQVVPAGKLIERSEISCVINVSFLIRYINSSDFTFTLLFYALSNLSHK